MVGLYQELGRCCLTSTSDGKSSIVDFVVFGISHIPFELFYFPFLRCHPFCFSHHLSRNLTLAQICPGCKKRNLANSFSLKCQNTIVTIVCLQITHIAYICTKFARQALESPIFGKEIEAQKFSNLSTLAHQEAKKLVFIAGKHSQN